MSSKHYSDKFKLDMDDYDLPEASPDQAFREDMYTFKLEKLGHRVTLITILIPILIAVIIVVSYLDIKQKVVQTQTTGTLGVRNLAKDLESRFSSLSVRQAKLEDIIEKQQQNADKNWAEYAVQNKKIEDNFSSLIEKMADKDKLSEAIRKFNASLTTLQKDIAANYKAIKELESTSTNRLEQIATLNQETQQKIEELTQTTSQLEQEKLDGKKLDFLLKIRDLKLQESFKEHNQSLEKEISGLKEEYVQLTQDLKTALEQIERISIKTSQPKTAPPSPPKQSKPTPSPQKGNIVEQDLQ